MAFIISGLRAWARANPRRLGRLSILFGLFVTGWLANYDPFSKPTWKDYDVTAIEKISTPHHGQVDRAYRLNLADGKKIGVDEKIASLFNNALLLRQPLPVTVEVFGTHDIDNGIVWAQGIRLKNELVVLDPATTKAANQTVRWPALLVGGFFVVLGAALQFKKPR